MRTLKPILTFAVLLIFTTSCEKEIYKVEYSITSGLNIFPANIVYIDENQNEQTLQLHTLPWSYDFSGDEGMEFRISAKVVPVGNNALIGVDTLRLKITINGSVLKEAVGQIDGGGSGIVIISDKL